MRRMLTVVAIVVVIAGAGVLAYTLVPTQTTENRKIALVNTLFAPQISQVEMIGDQLAQQFEAYRATNEDLAEEKTEKARALIAEAEDNMRETVQGTLTETYTLRELKEKKEFEGSDLAAALAAHERDVLSMMHVVGKKLGREAILRSVDNEFEDEEAQALRAVVQDLAGNAEMPNDERAALIADKMDMVQDQANIMLTLLSVSKADAVKEQQVLDYNRQSIPDEKLALAREYVELTRLDTVFGETVEQMVQEANLQAAYEDARQQMVAGVAHLYEKETLREANEYFSRDIAQRILDKDMQVAEKISPRIQEQMQSLNEQLAQIVQGS